MNPLVLGMVMVFLLSKRPTDVTATDSDLDALTKMLIAETGFERGEQEMAQNVFVALNRAKKYKTTPAAIVSPPGKPVWNTGSLYKQRFEAARKNPRWAAAQAFIVKVLAGAYSNLGATKFIHPGAMPVPPCADNRTASQTIAGTRCIPEWSVGSRVIGGAMFT